MANNNTDDNIITAQSVNVFDVSSIEDEPMHNFQSMSNVYTSNPKIEMIRNTENKIVAKEYDIDHKGHKNETITSADKKNNLKTEDQFNRVSLNICPLTFRNDNTYYPSTSIGKRLEYVLGSNPDGLLRRNFSSTYGIIFPYTPGIDMSFQAEYDSSTILHSNLSINMYKNTPPSEISLRADFTADNEKNAEYMYAVMIFLKAMTKTDFGIKAKERNVAGMPPPILYLNGWGSAYINVPVVIKSFKIDYGKDMQYVFLPSCNIWLPTNMSFNISLTIQPNLEKYKNQFDLDAYKNDTLNDADNVTLMTATEMVRNREWTQKTEIVDQYTTMSKGEAKEKGYYTDEEVGKWANNVTVPVQTGKNKKRINMPTYTTELKISQYNKKVQFSGHGWTW